MCETHLTSHARPEKYFFRAAGTHKRGPLCAQRITKSSLTTLRPTRCFSFNAANAKCASKAFFNPVTRPLLRSQKSQLYYFRRLSLCVWSGARCLVPVFASYHNSKPTWSYNLVELISTCLRLFHLPLESALAIKLILIWCGGQVLSIVDGGNMAGWSSRPRFNLNM